MLQHGTVRAEQEKQHGNKIYCTYCSMGAGNTQKRCTRKHTAKGRLSSIEIATKRCRFSKQCVGSSKFTRNSLKLARSGL